MSLLPIIFSEILPFTNVVSNVCLLSVLWPGTDVIAPGDVEGCHSRTLWYLALALSVVGTLVDLMPHTLLLSEIAMHPRVMKSGEKGNLKKMLPLIFSDGKPIVAFAAEHDAEDELLLTVQKSLRRRLSAVAAGLQMHEQSCGGQEHRPLSWTYAAVLVMLAGGQILTAIGACLFIHIDQGWPATFSLVASIFALVVSTSRNMTLVAETPLHPCPHERDDPDGGRLIEFLLPGSLTFLRYLLAIPVWPMLLVYLEAFFETLPFWREKEGATIHRQETSEALWVSPVAWLSVKSPAFAFSAGENIEKFFDERSWLSLVMWLIAPHLVWTIAATLRTVLFGTCMKCAEHLPCSRSHDATDSQERRKRSWGFHFTVQESLTLYDWRAKEDYKFHKWSVRAQGLLGLGLTRAISTVLWAPVLGVGLVFAVSLSAARELGPHRKVCVEQELAFLYAHAAWWAIVGSVHFARRRDGESVSQQSVDDVEMQSPAAGATVADGDDIDLVAPCHGSGIKESTGDYSTTGPKRKTSDVMPDIQELAKPGELGDEDDVHGTRAVDSSRDEEATASYSSRSGDSAHSSAHHGEQTTSCDKSEETAEPRSRTPSWRDAVQAAASAPNYTNDDDNRGNLSYSSDDVDIEAVDGSMLHNREFDLAAAPQHGSSATFVPRSSSSPSRDVGVTTMAVRLPNEAGAAATATPPTDGMEAPPTAVRFAESAGTDAGAEAPAAVRFADSVEAPPTTVQFADGVSADNGAEAPTAVRFADDTTEATRFNNPSGNAEVPATATRPSVRVAAPQQSSRPPRARAPYSPRDAEATSPYSTRDGMEAAAALPITAGHDMTISCPSDDLDETASYSSRNLEPTPHFSPRDFGPTFSSFSRSVETRVMSPDPADFRPPSRSPVRGAETEEEFNSLRRSQPTAEYFSDDDAGSRVADSHV